DPHADPDALLRAPPDGLPPRVRRRLLDPPLARRAAALTEAAARHDLLLLTPVDPRYPDGLRALPLRPNALFVRGDPRALQHAPAIALVGSRTPTPYGTAAADAFAGALARAGVGLWSGLARGIDAIAHRACLRPGAPTVAVLAGGLDRIYPPEHDELARAIVAAGGCLLSELPPGRRALRGHFPRRNRILAAAAAVLVVEAGATSGALHTARFAAANGRTAFAVPGPWSSPRSQGCHALLQEGASVAADPAEVLRDLGVSAAVDGAAAHALQRSGDGAAIWRCLQRGPRPADLVLRESGLSRAAFLRARLQLEATGLLRTLPGDLLAPAD
ncbi:MAG: DNA-processing protein DprA, partial [Planctomycetota bacterium]